MKLRKYRTRRRICRVMRCISFAIIWIGIISIVGTCGAIEDVMSLIRGIKQLAIEIAVVLTACFTHDFFGWMENQTISIRDLIRKKRG